MSYDDPFSGERYNNFPFPVTEIENGGGDLLLGGKFALVANALSLFGQLKVPTASAEDGRGTGGTDITIGAAGSLVSGPVGVHGNASYTFVGDGNGNGRSDTAPNGNGKGNGLARH